MKRVRSEFLPFSPPSIGAAEIDEVVATLQSDWITTGPRVMAFQEQFGSYVDAPGRTSLMLNSCTAGLHVALAVLGVGPGDEVIVPTLTFAATANVVEHVGARPVFVDVVPDTLCIDPAQVAAAITDRTKVIIPVHYAGHPSEMDAIMGLAEANGLDVVEDAAHAVGATFRGKKIGASENLTAFSFYATKNMTTIEGGALTGTREALDRARILGLHGMSKDAWRRFDRNGSWDYDIVAPGFKYNMTDVQAAIGQHQLERLAQFMELRRAVVRRYQVALAPFEALELPVELGHVTSSWHLFVVRLTEAAGLTRGELIDALKERNIGTSVHYRPVHLMTYYAEKYGLGRGRMPVAEDAFDRMVSLPLSARLNDGDVSDVIAAVVDILEARA